MTRLVTCCSASDKEGKASAIAACRGIRRIPPVVDKGSGQMCEEKSELRDVKQQERLTSSVFNGKRLQKKNPRAGQSGERGHLELQSF